MRLRKVIGILCVGGWCSLLLEAGNQGPAPQKEITYSKDVAPVLYKNCVMCHRPNDIAPMSLLTYEEVLPFAGLIRQSVDQRKMPPWHADPGVGEFMNDARLSDADIRTIDEWVKGGMKKGDAKDMPSAPAFEPGWHIKPDVIFTIPEFLVPKTALDDYEYIYVPTNFSEDKWIQAGEVLPGDRRVVHHATVSVRNSRSPFRLFEYRSRDLPAGPHAGSPASGIRAADSCGWVSAISGSLQQSSRPGCQGSHERRPGVCQRTGGARSRAVRNLE